jgi:hypothetical protein
VSQPSGSSRERIAGRWSPTLSAPIPGDSICQPGGPSRPSAPTPAVCQKWNIPCLCTPNDPAE